MSTYNKIMKQTRLFTLENKDAVSSFTASYNSSTTLPSSWISMIISSIPDSSATFDHPTILTIIDVPSSTPNSSYSFSMDYLFYDSEGHNHSLTSSSITVSIWNSQWLNLYEVKINDRIKNINFDSSLTCNTNNIFDLIIDNGSKLEFSLADTPPSSVNIYNLKPNDTINKIVFNFTGFTKEAGNQQLDFNDYTYINFSAFPEEPIEEAISYNGYNIWQTNSYQPNHTWSDGTIWDLDSKTLKFAVDKVVENNNITNDYSGTVLAYVTINEKLIENVVFGDQIEEMYFEQPFYTNDDSLYSHELVFYDNSFILISSITLPNGNIGTYLSYTTSDGSDSYNIQLTTYDSPPYTTQFFPSYTWSDGTIWDLDTLTLKFKKIKVALTNNILGVDIESGECWMRTAIDKYINYITSSNSYPIWSWSNGYQSSWNADDGTIWNSIDLGLWFPKWYVVSSIDISSSLYNGLINVLDIVSSIPFNNEKN